jgi:osmotically inducible lipoprotein OsmB
MSLRTVMAFAVTAMLLAACGQTTGDRALSGGALGAGAGAVAGSLAGAPLEGALVGGALGAGAGAVTSPNQVDLGRPAWR